MGKLWKVKLEIAGKLRFGESETDSQSIHPIQTVISNVMLYNFLHYSSFVINGSMLQEALCRFHEWCSRNHDLHRFAHHPYIWWLGLKSTFYKKGLLKSGRLLNLQEISLHKTWFMQGNFVQILWSTPFAKSFLIKNGLYVRTYYT